MGRNLEDIWDGRFYDRDDLVRADCGGCQGCSSCCRGMGDTVALDPYDCHQLAAGLSAAPMELLAQGRLALHVSQGVIVPHLPMSGAGESCVFLDGGGRCTVHAFRPGFCRLFPLGRYYEGDGFRYFLQKDECAKKNRAKIRVGKWLDIPNLPRYEAWVSRWHSFLLSKQIAFSACTDGRRLRENNMGLLERLYWTPLTPGRDAFEELEERLARLEEPGAETVKG